MTFDIAQIAASKAARRRHLAALPYAEKLRILDAIRQRDAVLLQNRISLKRVEGKSVRA
jgi:hypothetical protein